MSVILFTQRRGGQVTLLSDQRAETILQWFSLGVQNVHCRGYQYLQQYNKQNFVLAACAISRADKGKFQKKKADPLYIKAVVAYYSKQCNLREINTFLFSVTN